MVAGFAEVIEVEETFVAEACNHFRPRRLDLDMGSPLVRSPAVQAASTVSFKPTALATANNVDSRGLPLADNAR